MKVYRLPGLGRVFTLQSWLQYVIMKPPTEPSKEDCCNSGCNPCIFDVYENQLNKYKKYLEYGEAVEDQQNVCDGNLISQLEYTSFVVVNTAKLCEQHILVSFRSLESRGATEKLWWKPGDHFLIKYSGEKPCTRAYTPIKEKDNQQGFSIIVKIYKDGLVSKYIKNLKIGDHTIWRGPYGHYEYIPNKFNRLIMIAQGTGIAPFLGIIEKILNNEDDMTKIVLFFCVKCTETILMREKLYSYKEYWNFSYKIFLSKANNMQCKYQEPLLFHKLELADLNELEPFQSHKEQFLLCGSAQFMEDLKLLLFDQKVSSEDIVLF